MTIALLGLALVSLALATDLAFIGWYSYATTWWRAPIGQTLVIQSACLAALYAWTLVVRIWPHIPARALISLLLFAVLTAVTVWRFVILIRITKTAHLLRDELDRLHAKATELENEDRGLEQ